METNIDKQVSKFEDRKLHEETLPAAPADTSPNAVVLAAMEKGYDPALIEKMMDLQERHEANEAKKAYVEAMNAFKANPPEIHKDKKVSYKAGQGKTEYSHATLAKVADKISKGLSEHGFSHGWTTQQNNGDVTVTCIITHKLGHSESTSLTAPTDTSGSKNPIQAIGSTVSYLERYTILALTGLATHDMDDDGNAGGTKMVSDKELSQIVDMLNDLEQKDAQDKLLEYLESPTLKGIPKSKFNMAVIALGKKKAAEVNKKATEGKRAKEKAA